MTSTEVNNSSGAQGAGARTGKIFLDQKDGRIEVYDDVNDLIVEIAKLSAPSAGEPAYAIKLYKQSSLLVGDQGTVRVGSRLTISNNLIKMNDGSNDRIYLGLLPDGSFGLVVSKQGYNVPDAF